MAYVVVCVQVMAVGHAYEMQHAADRVPTLQLGCYGMQLQLSIKRVCGRPCSWLACRLIGSVHA